MRSSPVLRAYFGDLVARGNRAGNTGAASCSDPVQRNAVTPCHRLWLTCTVRNIIKYSQINGNYNLWGHFGVPAVTGVDGDIITEHGSRLAILSRPRFASFVIPPFTRESDYPMVL